MTENLNMKLLKQHIAILQTHMESINRLADSLEQDTSALETDLEEQPTQSAMEALKACERAQERARVAEAKLDQAIKDLHHIMSGGDPCKVCTVKCLMGEGNCKPVWRGEVAGQ
jgi:uncharacterized membrane protein YccC